MSRVRFNRISLVLLVAAALCALEIIPGSYPDAARARAQNLFAPVAMPIRALAQWLHSSAGSRHAGDEQADAQLQDENAELRVMVANLRGQLDRVDQQTAEMGYLGPVRFACTRYRVIGSDSSTRDTLTIAGSSLAGVARGMPVVYPQGLVGRIERAGPAGAQVRLIGDVGFRFIGAFARWTTDARGHLVYSRLPIAPTLIEGIGNDTMVARGLSLEDAQKQGIAPNVWVVLDDDAWPVGLKDYHVGKVVEVGPRPDAPRFAQIVIRPSTDLMDLRDVMVMTRQ
jgi:hypothetical protein